jgi:hypothetical protein
MAIEKKLNTHTPMPPESRNQIPYPSSVAGDINSCPRSVNKKMTGIQVEK